MAVIIFCVFYSSFLWAPLSKQWRFLPFLQNPTLTSTGGLHNSFSSATSGFLKTETISRMLLPIRKWLKRYSRRVAEEASAYPPRLGGYESVFCHSLKHAEECRLFFRLHPEIYAGTFSSRYGDPRIHGIPCGRRSVF